MGRHWGGTGSNLEHFSSSMNLFGKVVVLDLCRPLAAVCRERIEANGWSNVSVVIGDATEFPNRNLPQADTPSTL